MIDLDAWPAFPTRSGRRPRRRSTSTRRCWASSSSPSIRHSRSGCTRASYSTPAASRPDRWPRAGASSTAGIDVVDSVLRARGGGEPGDRGAARRRAQRRRGVGGLPGGPGPTRRGGGHLGQAAGAARRHAVLRQHPRAHLRRRQARRFHRLLCTVDGAFEEFRSQFFGRTGRAVLVGRVRPCRAAVQRKAGDAPRGSRLHHALRPRRRAPERRLLAGRRQRAAARSSTPTSTPAPTAARRPR